MITIPVNRPNIPKKAAEYLTQCLDDGWISSEGPFVAQFEQAFVHFCGTRFASTTSSGTAALHLALLALGVGPGDEVILPASTMGACFFAIWYTGAKAVPVDVDPVTYTLDPRLIEAKVSSKTKVIMAVHLFGHPCDMDPILAIAKKHQLSVLEDAAQAHGARYKGKMVGTMGDVGCFSFYANKIVTTGEGGMVVTNNQSIYDLVKSLKDQSFSKEKRFTHDRIGYNYRMTNLQAAVGLASLERIGESIRYKRQMAKLYSQGLKKISGLVVPTVQAWAKSVYWMYTVLIKEKEFGMSRDELVTTLANSYGIQTRTFFYPPQVAFEKIGVYNQQRYPVAERLAQQGIYLPSGLGNLLEEFQTTVQAIQAIYTKQVKS